MAGAVVATTLGGGRAPHPVEPPVFNTPETVPIYPPGEPLWTADATKEVLLEDGSWNRTLIRTGTAFVSGVKELLW